MLNIELQEAFEIELNQLDDNLTKPTTIKTEYFLNAGLALFWKSRYSKNNFKQESFELTQKRIDDLRTLVTRHLYITDDITTVDKSLYSVELPNDYIILLGDTAGITPAVGTISDCWEIDDKGIYVTKYSDTIEGTIETLDRIKENSLSEYHLHYTKAKPIRLLSGNTIKLYTDGNYQVSTYSIDYLRKPNKIDIHTKPFEEYIDMPEHTHIEIVKLAAQLYMENQANPRNQTYATTVAAME